jgi:hypothetical protein
VVVVKDEVVPGVNIAPTFKPFPFCRGVEVTNDSDGDRPVLIPSLNHKFSSPKAVVFWSFRYKVAPKGVRGADIKGRSGFRSGGHVWTAREM